MLMQNKLQDLFSAKPKPEQLLDEVSYVGIIRFIKDNKCKNIITMAGAGISTCEYLSSSSTLLSPCV